MEYGNLFRVKNVLILLKIKDFYLKKDLKGCLKYLLNESSKRWIKEEEVIDDITAVIIFFEN